MSVTKNLSRSKRRHHVARLKKARRHHWGAERYRNPPLDERRIGILVHTTVVCRCCGNPRRLLSERTIQERRLFQDLLQRDE